MRDLELQPHSDWRLIVNDLAVVRGCEHTGKVTGRVLRPATERTGPR